MPLPRRLEQDEVFNAFPPPPPLPSVTQNQSALRPWFNQHADSRFRSDSGFVRFMARMLDKHRIEPSQLHSMLPLTVKPSDHWDNAEDQLEEALYLLRANQFRKRTLIPDADPPMQQRANPALGLEEIQHVFLTHAANVSGL